MCEQAIGSAIKTSVASSWHFISTYKSNRFRGTVREPCSRKKIRNPGIQRALLEETKKSAYFKHPDFSAAKIKKKCANYARKYGIVRIVPYTIGLTVASGIACSRFVAPSV